MDYMNAGGFLAEPSSMHGGQGGVDSPAGKKRMTNQSIRAVTVKQILDCPQSPSDSTQFVMDGQELGQVTLVGCIRRIVQQSTNTNYTLEDGTGSIEAKLWFDANESEYLSNKRGAVRENSYVHMVAVVRFVAGRRMLNVTKIRPVQDFNEVTFHLLEAISSYLQLTRGQPGQQGGMRAGSGMAGGARMPSNNDYPTNSAYAPQQAMGGGGSGMMDDFSPLQRSVLEKAAELGRGADGVQIDLLRKRVAALGFPEANVSEAVDWLMGEGHLYQTTDDHVKPM